MKSTGHEYAQRGVAEKCRGGRRINSIEMAILGNINTQNTVNVSVYDSQRNNCLLARNPVE
jgi:hypothetical protein